MKIDIQAIAASEHRYPTVGDWFYELGVEGDELCIRVTALNNPLYEQLLAFHELTEALICARLGVTEEQVDTWDFAYERMRDEQAAMPSTRLRLTCGCPLRDEPGSDPHAPYHAAHHIADLCERLMATALEVDWEAYTDAIEAACES